MKPILYPPNETAFDNNGIGALSDAISCFVEREVNGIYEMTMTYPVDGKRMDGIVDRALILARPSPFDTPQPFRVYRITEPMRGTVTVYARHLAYDLIGTPVRPFKASTAPAAMAALNANAAVSCPFAFSTDKPTQATMDTKTPKDVWSLLGGSEGSILDVYGGEYEFDRYNVRLLKRLGEDRGVTIRYGKNLTSLEQDKNCASVYTGVYPYWADADGNLVTLDEEIVPVDGTFDHVRILTLDMSSYFETAPTQEQLRSRTRTYIKANNIGVPDVSLTVSFVQLSKTAEYRDKALLEEIRIGDTITVVFPKLGLHASSRAVKTRYNVLLDRYESVTLGKVKAKISDTIAENSAKISVESQQRISADRKFQSELTVQGEKIAAKVEAVGGDPESFGWELLSSSWTLNASGKVVLKATKSGIDVNGKITAYEGRIANFDIKQDCLSYNGQTWGGTNTTGIYLGANGIQCGANSYWRNDGYFKAVNGEFTGSVNAGSIRAGGDYGTLSGEGISSGSIYGNRLRSNTVTTAYTSSGINTSLSYANFANDVFTGVETADSVICQSLRATNSASVKVLYINGVSVTKKSKTFTDGNGDSVTIAYWG